MSRFAAFAARILGAFSAPRAVASLENSIAVDETATQEPATFSIGHVRLLQPEWIIEKRTTVQSLSFATNAVTAAMSEWLRRHGDMTRADAFVVYVAIRPQRALNVWTACADGARADDVASLDDHLRRALKGESAGECTDLVTFSIHGKNSIDAIPTSWSSALGTGNLPIEALVEKVWPR